MVRKHSASRLWANGRLSQNTPIAGAHVFALVPVRIAAAGGRIGCLRNQLFSETLRLIVVIEGASVIERILRHLRLLSEVPTPRPGRAPPLFLARSFDEDTGSSAFDPRA